MEMDGGLPPVIYLVSKDTVVELNVFLMSSTAASIKVSAPSLFLHFQLKIGVDPLKK
jgi:hypothetical protein